MPRGCVPRDQGDYEREDVAKAACWRRKFVRGHGRSCGPKVLQPWDERQQRRELRVHALAVRGALYQHVPGVQICTRQQAAKQWLWIRARPAGRERNRRRIAADLSRWLTCAHGTLPARDGQGAGAQRHHHVDGHVGPQQPRLLDSQRRRVVGRGGAVLKPAADASTHSMPCHAMP
jgi:hypothetical protein